MKHSLICRLSSIVTGPLKGANYFATKAMTDPLVTVTQGQLRGSQLQLLDGSPYYSFKGIPYAHVPGRFLAPIPSKPWHGVLDATKHGPICPQYNIMTRIQCNGDENCLYLNVYTKSLKPKDKVPVMVFIHGGAYMTGSGNTEDGLGPEFLLQHNVILVTLNYRLELFGFLCLDTPEVPGNAGMKDQVAALKWIKNNIEQFGGDADNITLFGESAGASSVTFHMQSPMSKGLFNKAIAQSGVSTIDWAQGKDGKERAFRAAKLLGKDTTDTAEVLKFLRSVPAEKLTKLTFRTMTEDEKHRGLPIHFAPVIEKRFDNVEAFITEEPIDCLLSSKMHKMPLMLGYTSDESMLMIPNMVKKSEFLNNNPQYCVPREIAKRVTVEKAKEIGERVKKFYTSNKGFAEDDLVPFLDWLSDLHFVHGIHRFANFYAKDSPTYMYKFSCDTELNLVKKISGMGHLKGAAHADDLFYLFYSDMISHSYIEEPKLKDIVYKITKLWTHFAKTGNPTPDDSLGLIWSQYSPTNQQYLDIDQELTPGLEANKNRVNFWNKLYSEVGLACTVSSNL